MIFPGYLEECSLTARLRYSLALKSLGRLEIASQIWKAALTDTDDCQAYGHLLELAKYQEHKEKDPESALETVDLLLGLESTSRKKSDLLHRRKRLYNKVVRLSSKSL